MTGSVPSSVADGPRTDPPAARTALVTGASRGIGRELALGMARAGLDVALLARDEARLTDVAQEVGAHGVRAVVLVADVTDHAGVGAAVRRAEEELGSVDLLVNNAGRVDTEVPLWEADPEEWWSVVETDVRGPFLLAHAVVPGMLARGGGRVVDLNSGSGTRDSALATAYTVAKTALFRIGGALHEAGHGQGLRAFELAPGVVRTDMTASMRVHADRTEWTPAEASTDLVTAIARGELDELSGCYLRAGVDTPASLREAVDAGRHRDGARRLAVTGWART